MRSRRRMRAWRRRATCATTPSSSLPRWIRRASTLVRVRVWVRVGVGVRVRVRTRRASTHRALHGTDPPTPPSPIPPPSSPRLASTHAHAHPPAVAATICHRGDAAEARPTNGRVVRELVKCLLLPLSASRASSRAVLLGCAVCLCTLALCTHLRTCLVDRPSVPAVRAPCSRPSWAQDHRAGVRFLATRELLTC